VIRRRARRGGDPIGEAPRSADPIGEVPRASGGLGDAPQPGDPVGDAPQPGDPIGEAPQPGDGDPAAAWINFARMDDRRRSVTGEPDGTNFVHAGEDDPRGDGGGSGDDGPAARPAAGGSPRSLSAAELSEHRAALIDLVIYAYDRTASAGIRARLADGLAAIGVTVVRPDGEPFDPSRQEAGGVQPTQDAALHDRIAETERVGFADGERLIREPVVVVYRRR
jgi:hypothetical protein